MYGQDYICQDVGRIKSISLNDEVICSSRVIFATVLDKNEEAVNIQMVRELYPELYGEFDQLWETVEKSGEDKLVGAEVTINQHSNYPETDCFYYTTIALQ